MADYILNMGGQNGSGHTNAVDVFKITETDVELIPDHGLTLSQARSGPAVAVCGDYVFAMGGLIGLSSNVVDIFKATENGVEAVPDHGLSLSVGLRGLAAASAGNYVLAMGGDAAAGGNYKNTVDVFKVTDNGVEAVPDHGLTLSEARNSLKAVSCGNYIMAMGGLAGYNNYSATVDVFKVTESGVEHITDHGLSLSLGRSGLAAVSCGEYVLAMGGFYTYNDSYVYTNAIDVFHVTENGIEHILDHGLTLSTTRAVFPAVSCKGYIFTLGGKDDINSKPSNVIDMFKLTPQGIVAIPDHGLALSEGRTPSAAAIGNCVLAMGGSPTGNVTLPSNVIDVFQIFD